MIRVLTMANSVDHGHTTYKEWQIVLTLIRLLRMANSVDADQTENSK